MNLRDLNYLVAVAEEGHFGKAADRCFVSQPTLSMQLKKLEQELGVCFFERDNKNVLITPIGAELVSRAREILRNVSALRDAARYAHDPFSGSFRLGIIPTLGPYLLPHILKPLSDALPNLTLSVNENKTGTILELLRSGALDAVILAFPVQDEGLISQDLFSEPFYVALPRGHRLGCFSELNMAHLEGETLLLLEEGHCLRNQALEACESRVGAVSPDFRATSLETIRHLVTAGAGITYLPALAVASAERDRVIDVKAFAEPLPARRIGMLWRKKAVREPCCQKLTELIKAVVGKNKYLKVNSEHRAMQRVIDG